VRADVQNSAEREGGLASCMAGAAVTSLLFTVGKFLIGLYIGKSSIASSYGAAGALVVLLIWCTTQRRFFCLEPSLPALMRRCAGRAKCMTCVPSPFKPFKAEDRRGWGSGVRTPAPALHLEALESGEATLRGTVCWSFPTHPAALYSTRYRRSVSGAGSTPSTAASCLRQRRYVHNASLRWPMVT